MKNLKSLVVSVNLNCTKCLMYVWLLVLNIARQGGGGGIYENVSFKKEKSAKCSKPTALFVKIIRECVSTVQECKNC